MWNLVVIKYYIYLFGISRWFFNMFTCVSYMAFAGNNSKCRCQFLAFSHFTKETIAIDWTVTQVDCHNCCWCNDTPIVTCAEPVSNYRTQMTTGNQQSNNNTVITIITKLLYHNWSDIFILENEVCNLSVSFSMQMHRSILIEYGNTQKGSKAK